VGLFRSPSSLCLGASVVPKIGRLSSTRAAPMKARTHHESARRGFPGHGTCDDLEAARLQANELARPWGHLGPSPVEAWRSRKRISAKERKRFARMVRTCLRQLEIERRPVADQRALQREAIARALVRHGLLAFTSTYVQQRWPPRRRGRPPPRFSG
jgi:hypothetical protein